MYLCLYMMYERLLLYSLGVSLGFVGSVSAGQEPLSNPTQPWVNKVHYYMIIISGGWGSLARLN